eukprot:TRINITY_DN22428_c0_g1_i2.p1 TRINITY_DN22428_c0_g1~~TRINITY_DN22428_c0_g1_i2.p1  ORF type:complete len:351 (-),score=68.48 TRINITY_DN22428_c0_g1_i2:71-1123(-)
MEFEGGRVCSLQSPRGYNRNELPEKIIRLADALEPRGYNRNELPEKIIRLADALEPRGYNRNVLPEKVSKSNLDGCYNIPGCAPPPRPPMKTRWERDISDNQRRQALYAKEPERERVGRGRSSRQTLTIFDWDDTLLCTTFLLNHSDENGLAFSPSCMQHLRDIEANAKRLLELALSRGQVLIITNGEEGWVQHSAAKWLPGLLPILRRDKLVVSARSRFEGQYLGDPGRWKIATFKSVAAEFTSDLTNVSLNLVSLGDSEHDLQAAREMGNLCKPSFIKTVKFAQAPSPDMLSREMALVVNKYEKIVDTQKDLTIKLGKVKVTPQTRDQLAKSIVDDGIATKRGAHFCF